MFDIFYAGDPIRLLGCEQNFKGLLQPAASLADAKAKSRTKYFWYIDIRFDYTNFADTIKTWFPQWSEVHQTHVHLLRSQYEEFEAVFAPADINLPEVLHYHHSDERLFVPRVASRKYWHIPEDIIDASTIDFTWAPPHYDTTPYIYHFGSEFQQSIGLTYTVPGAVDAKFIGLPPTLATEVVINKEAEIFFVDMNNSMSTTQFEKIKSRYPSTQSLRFMNNWVDTIKRCLAKATATRFWVISSENDYSEFNFNWLPSAWQTYMLHVFPTDNLQKFGDTFYVHGPSFRAQAVHNSDLSTWYNVNYCESTAETKVKQLQHEVVIYDTDTVVEAIKAHRFAGSYAWFINGNTIENKIPPDNFTTSSWSKKFRPVYAFNKSGSVLAVPRDAQLAVNSQVYDYEFIDTDAISSNSFIDRPLDIVYISNGEPDAEKWYEHLVSLRLPNRIRRVKNVKGRKESFNAAASESLTKWYFAVWAKLEINSQFDFNWQPDYMQEPKHYIFNAVNPVNELTYGHMAMVAYNKDLVIETTDPGLDFTLSKKHEVVELISGTAHFNSSPILAWRTAFRECIKLKDAKDTVSDTRLSIWCNKATGVNADWVLAGANDAVEYYESVAGEPNKLMLSFEWEWLDNYFANKYPGTAIKTF